MESWPLEVDALDAPAAIPNVVKRDMKAVGIDTETWENLAADWSQWRGAVTKHLKIGEDKLTQAATERRARRKLCISRTERREEAME